jgi:hypothetical protein
MKRAGDLVIWGLFLMLLCGATMGQKDEERRLTECALVMKEILGIAEGIPQDLLNKAECVAVMPFSQEVCFRFWREPALACSWVEQPLISSCWS